MHFNATRLKLRAKYWRLGNEILIKKPNLCLLCFSVCEQTTKVFPSLTTADFPASTNLASAVATSKAIDMAQRENKIGSKKGCWHFSNTLVAQWNVPGISELISDCWKFISLHLFDAFHYPLWISPHDSSVPATLENSNPKLNSLFLVMKVISPVTGSCKLSC